MKKYRKQNYGFSLIELTIVLLIVGLLIGTMVNGFTTYQENRLINEATRDLKQIKAALIGFAISQPRPRLPCPDDVSDGDGSEDLTAGNQCSVPFGWLPHRDLGIRASEDPWGRRYLYRVDMAFADDVIAGQNAPCPAPTQASFTLCDTATSLQIHDTGGFSKLDCADDSTSCNVMAENIVAVVISSGADGFQSTSTDELDNMNDLFSSLASDSAEEVFVAAGFSEAQGTGFDDQVNWISAAEIKAQMVRAGWLP